MLGRDHFVPSVDEAVKGLLKPKMVRELAIVIKITNFAAVIYVAFSAQRSQGAHVRVHGYVDQPRVVAETLHVTWSIHPIDAQRVYGRVAAVLLGAKFHDATEVVRIAWGLADQIHMI